MDSETFARFLRDAGQEYKDFHKLWGSAEILTKLNGFLDFLDTKYRKQLETDAEFRAVEKHCGPCDCADGEMAGVP